MPTLYRNARVPAAGAASALLVGDDGRIAALLDDDGARDAADRSGTRQVDLHGALVTPAFVDAHVHATATGLGLTAVDLAGARSREDVLAAVAAAAAGAPGEPILGGGWDETGWPDRRPPTTAELDRAGGGALVYLARVDVHSAVVSSALLARVPGGLAAGRPGVGVDGWIREPAHDVVREVATAALTPARRRAAQRATLARAAALGIAAVHEMAGPVISSEADLLDLLVLAADPALPDVVGYWGELGGVERARDLGAVGAAGDLFCDGSLGSATAALTADYAGRPGDTGLLRFATEDMAAHVEACLDAGLQSGFHAIGDAAVDQVLDAYEMVAARRGRPVGAGQRIEHAEYVRDPRRLAASGLTASVQPCFDALWGGPHGMYAERLGAERALALNRLGDLAAAGVPLVFGSDSPVTELGPWAAVRAAAHHHDPAASLGLAAALDAHTRAGWRAGAWPGDGSNGDGSSGDGSDGDGVLAPGGPATFAVWDAAVGPEGLPPLGPDDPLPGCLATVLRGTVLHDAGLLGA